VTLETGNGTKNASLEQDLEGDHERAAQPEAQLWQRRGVLGILTASRRRERGSVGAPALTQETWRGPARKGWMQT